MTLSKHRAFIAFSAAYPWLRFTFVIPAAIHSVELRTPVVVAESHGAPGAPTLASDGNLYSASDESHGLRNATASRIAFQRLEASDPIRQRQLAK